MINWFASIAFLLLAGVTVINFAETSGTLIETLPCLTYFLIANIYIATMLTK